MHQLYVCVTSPASVVDSKSAPDTCRNGIRSFMVDMPRHFICSFLHSSVMVMAAPAYVVR